MLRLFRSFPRFSTRALMQNTIDWRVNNSNLIELLLEDQSLLRATKIIYVLPDKISFKELMQRPLFMRYSFKLPKDFDPTINVSQFLNDFENPKAIEVTIGDKIYYLKNKARDIEYYYIMNNYYAEKGVYPIVQKAKENLIGSVKYQLELFYIRLQAQTFFKTKNYSQKTQLTPAIREKLLSYLCYENETKDHQQIISSIKNQQALLTKIQHTQEKIKSIEEDADKLLKLYQYGVIAITAAHIVSFGYMIFFVEWLGWDIIEPLTFSVSCLYLLIGLRFYRRFRKDRNELSIRDRFRELVLKPSKLMQLRELNFQLNQQKEFLKEIELNALIFKNRLSLKTTAI